MENIKNYSNIVYLGSVSHEVIIENIKKSIAIITPYKWYEGFPMIIAESFSVGCPVLSSSIGNAADIVTISGGGVTFNFNEKKSFENAIKECIEKNKDLSLKAYHYYQSVMSKEKNYERLSDIYDKSKII